MVALMGVLMLVLYRRAGETITIGDDVTVTIFGIKGNQVRIGIKAPEGIPVFREELYNRIKKEREAGIARPVPGNNKR